MYKKAEKEKKTAVQKHTRVNGIAFAKSSSIYMESQSRIAYGMVVSQKLSWTAPYTVLKKEGSVTTQHISNSKTSSYLMKQSISEVETCCVII